MRRPAAPTVLAIATVLALTACGSSGGSKSSTSVTASGTSSAGSAASASSAAVTPQRRAAITFATHAGVAFGTFYRFIYAPYKAGAFNPAKPNRAALVTARKAAAVVSHEIDMATRATHASAALAQLRAPMTTLDEGFKVALVKLKSGHFKLAEIQTADIAISAIKGSATNAGLPIPESAASV